MKRRATIIPRLVEDAKTAIYQVLQQVCVSVEHYLVDGIVRIFASLMIDVTGLVEHRFVTQKRSDLWQRQILRLVARHSLRGPWLLTATASRSLLRLLASLPSSTVSPTLGRLAASRCLIVNMLNLGRRRLFDHRFTCSLAAVKLRQQNRRYLLKARNLVKLVDRNRSSSLVPAERTTRAARFERLQSLRRSLRFLRAISLLLAHNVMVVLMLVRSILQAVVDARPALVVGAARAPVLWSAAVVLGAF